MGERPIIYIHIGAATEEEFTQAAAKQFRGDFFVAIDPPTVREIRIEAQFSSGPLGVRGDAIATPSTRNGAKGVLVRIVKLAPDSVAVPVWDPGAPPTPSPMSATLAKRPTSPTPDTSDPVEEFGAAITNTSSLSADIAKTLHTVTPPTPGPKAHAKLVRRTPVAGVPPIESPKPVIKSVPVPPEPSIDEEWSVDSPTARPAPIPKSEPRKPAPTPASPISSIGARATETPARGAPTFSPPRPTAPTIDDDAAFDSAFDALDQDDLVIPVEKPVASPPKIPSRPTPPSLPTAKPKPAPSSAPVRISSTTEDTKPTTYPTGSTDLPKELRAASDLTSPPPARLPRAASEPGHPRTVPRVPKTSPGEPKLARPGDASVRASASTTDDTKPTSYPASQPVRPQRAASEPRSGGAPVRASSSTTDDTKPTSYPAVTSGSKPTAPTSTSSPAKARATSEPKPSDTATNGSTTEPRVLGEPQDTAARPTSTPASARPRAASEPKPAASTAPAKPRATSEPKPTSAKPPSASEPAAPAPTSAPATSEPKPGPTSAPAVAGPTTAPSSKLSEPITPPAGATDEPAGESFVATGGFDNTKPTSRTPRQDLNTPVRPIPIGLNEAPTSVGVVAASRASSEAIASPRSRRWMMGLAMMAAIAVVIVVIVATRGGSKTETAGSGSATRSAELEKHLATAAARIQDGKLVGPDGDTALDHLLNAKKVAPRDKQVLEQLNLLANTFEKLGDGAIAAGDLGEAATHFQAALTAEPERRSAAKKLKDVEDRARGGKR